MIIREVEIKYRKTGTTGPSRKLSSSLAVYNYIRGSFEEYPHQEQIRVIAVNTKNAPIGQKMITLGTVCNSLVHPREVFNFLVSVSAASFFLVHNHPSGDPAPSAADIEVTRKLKEAGNVMSIQLLDHLICGESEEDPHGVGYYSFQEEGLIS